MTQTTPPRPKAPTVIVNVTKALIESGKKADSGHCMIAEAIKAARPNATCINIDIRTIRFSDPEKKLRYTYLTPTIAQRPIVWFDQGVTPEPFSFRLQGGTPTISGRPKKNRGKPPSEAQRAAIEKMQSISGTSKKEADSLKKTRLRRTSETSALQPVGGKPPPLTPFSRHRQFGIRALGMSETTKP